MNILKNNDDILGDNEENNLLINNMSENEIEWSVEHERIFTEWGDKAMCYKWMHSIIPVENKRYSIVFRCSQKI